MVYGENGSKKSTIVLTVRIDTELDQMITKLSRKKGLTKAAFIRNYLEMAKYLIVAQGSIRSTDDRDYVIIKRKIFKKFLESFEVQTQMEWGIKIARYINDLARLKGQLDNLEYKLDICEHLGFFNKFIDEENYLLFSNKFGPKKFVEAFVYKLINHEPKNEFDLTFTEEAIESSKKKEQEYKKKIGPVYRTDSYYAFEFAKLEK